MKSPFPSCIEDLCHELNAPPEMEGSMAAPKKIGIIGAGTMGAGIAQKTAQSGLDVVLMDIGDEQLKAGLSRIRKMLEKGVERGVFREGEPDKILGRIQGTTKVADMADCDLIVEAVFENLEVKRKLFADLEEVVRPDCILGTNTSSFKVEAVAEGAKRPERMIGLHYFFHPAQNRLLEVIPAAATSAQAREDSWAFAEATGKTAIHSDDAPGFVVNRFFVPWLNESVRLLGEGMADLPTIEDVAMKLFGIGMGPFKLMNVTGVPIAQHAAAGLASELGSFYEPCERLVEQVASKKDWDLDGEPSEKGAREVEDRLLGVVLMVAASLVEEGVSSMEDTDIGAMVGLRWPAGPFALANRMGVERSVKAAAAIADKYGLTLPGALAEKLESPAPFVLKAANLAVDDGVAVITMNRPNAMNALDPDTVASLAAAFDAAAADDAVKAIVIEGRGKAFIAGADIKFFLKNEIPRIESFTREGAELLLRIDRCEKPVVARLNGLALGGGAEVALSCDAIVADEGAVIGFPETGIGIYPGLGGTQRSVKRCGLPVARYMLFTGDVIPAAKAAAVGLVDRVAPSGTSMGMVKALLAEGAVDAGEGAGKLAQPDPAVVGKYEEIFSDANTGKLFDGTFEGADKEQQKIKKKFASKAPIAMKMAHDLMNKAVDAPIGDGVEAELGGLARIFATEDSKIGLSSVGGKERPVFTGK